MILPLLLDRSPTFCSLKFRFLALLFKIFWGITKMWHKIITFDSLYCHCSVVQLCLTLGYPMDCRLPCPSPSPRACSNSCPLSLWCHPTISPSVVPFSSCLQSFPESESFPMSWLFSSGGQSIGASASASVLPMDIQGWFPLGLTGLISLQSKGFSKYLQHRNSKASILQHSAFFMVQLSHTEILFHTLIF